MANVIFFAVYLVSRGIRFIFFCRETFSKGNSSLRNMKKKLRVVTHRKAEQRGLFVKRGTVIMLLDV